MSHERVEPAEFFALRTPLLPHDELVSWSRGLRAGEDASPSALADDRRMLRERLRAIVARGEVREALFVASPSLDDSIGAWLEDPESSRGQKVERTLVRYFIRMTSRPTPFGLFAGCSVGVVGTQTRLRVEGLGRYRRQPRLDAGYLATLTETLRRDPAVRRSLVYRANSSLYRLAGKVRFIETRVDKLERSYFLSAADDGEPLQLVLARCAGGATVDDMTAALHTALAGDGVTRAEAEAFVSELVDAQILVADLDLPLTGGEPLGALVDELRATAATGAVATALDETRAALAALAASPLGVPPARYRAIARGLAALPVEPELARLFQVDLVKPAPQATLGPEPIAEVARATSLLHRLARRPHGSDALSRFAEGFVARYDQREVPLCEALDEDLGIGFQRSTAPGAEVSPLLEGLAFAARPSDETPADPYDRLLFAKLEEALRSGAHEVALQPADVDRLAAARGSDPPPPLAESLAAMVTLGGPSEEAVSRGEFRLLLRSVSGPSGANLLGRFCYGDAALEACVRQYLKREERGRPELFAEIVHLPQGRSGNILLRPLLRDWEIAFLGRSGAPRERQILLDDLWLSVRAGRVVLRSRRLGREIIPRLTTAHNVSSPQHLGVYRFLCALQWQGVAPLQFSWGALEAASFLPRVRVGRTVLALARWRIGRDDLQTLAADDGDARFAAAQRLRRRHRLPRWVALVEGDHVLPIDLDNVLAVDTFAHLVKERAQIALTEPFADDGLCASGPEGSFVHEIVLPLVATRAANADAAAPPPPRIATTTRARSFPPGSEWLYAKLYAGATAADDVLRDTVAPLVAAVAGAVDSWFFVRYADPDWHLRVRFHGEPEQLQREVLPRLAAAAAAALADGRVWRFQLDTYERETERYGGDAGVALSEQLFYADSDAALGILETLRGDAGADARWRLALRGMDQLLDDLQLSLDEKLALMRGCRRAYGAEFRAEGLLERQLGERFRKERRVLEALLDRGRDADGPLAPGLAMLHVRSARLRPIAATLRAEIAGARVHAPLPELAASWLHMHANRLLRSAARAHELVLYDFLERLYDGQRSRR
jgi:thiopeptide-type bacteriocin biosynthesis protein